MSIPQPFLLRCVGIIESPESEVIRVQGTHTRSLMLLLGWALDLGGDLIQILEWKHTVF
jgi:hypothetical protein